MVFVHHFGSTRDTEEFRSSGVHLTITDGLVTSVIAMNPENYNGEEHWLAGCMRKISSGFEFEPVNSFLNSKPVRKFQICAWKSLDMKSVQKDPIHGMILADTMVRQCEDRLKKGLLEN